LYALLLGFEPWLEEIGGVEVALYIADDLGRAYGGRLVDRCGKEERY